MFIFSFFFFDFYGMVMEHQLFKMSEEIQKNFFFFFPKTQFTIEIASAKPIFDHRINFAVNIWK